MNILGAIGFNLRNVARFRGRDSRSRFWPYAILIVVLTSISAAKVMMPELTSSIERTHRFAIENPDKATIESHAGGYTVHLRGFYPELMPRLDKILPGLAAVLGVGVILLAASISRRLHDSGRTAAWMLLPIPMLVIGLVLFATLFAVFMAGEFEFNFLFIGLFVVLLLNNFAYLGSLLFLIAMLAKPSQTGDNLYGPAPATPT
ncbi:DUF805 domain-containing protein [Kaistia algarum]|uniref:DUF805 domain-containing protein n=1 Tax=Kaistia algarum TaxID=2083279 RepID=UPI000CE88756|nr:DUF805 domain-containing protein [Kaistia algarum]MCX5513310.1 DUF805 domain-containing protein [Kaistia algarum]